METKTKLKGLNRVEVIDKIREMIDCNNFTLSDRELKIIETEHPSELVQSWLFTYRVYAQNEQNRLQLLSQGLVSGNPRIREQACDIIGDEALFSLRAALTPLFDDGVLYVSQAAKFNHDNMF